MMSGLCLFKIENAGVIDTCGCRDRWRTDEWKGAAICPRWELTDKNSRFFLKFVVPNLRNPTWLLFPDLADFWFFTLWYELTQLGSPGVSSQNSVRLVWVHTEGLCDHIRFGDSLHLVVERWYDTFSAVEVISYHEEQVGYAKIILCLNFHLKRIDYRECVTSSFDQWQQIRQIHQIAQFFRVNSHQTKCLVWTHTMRTKWCEFIPTHKKSKIC